MNVIPFQVLDLHNEKEVGGKGVRLAYLYNSRFPVPPGFCLTVQAFNTIIRANKITNQIWREVLQQVEGLSNQNFRNNKLEDPLREILSVRSSGLFSMPGQMDSV
ncbi:MAG: PEP/pyruvate-binding domain-containing protein, partial [Cyanobacteria bacterium J06649_11]